ncbi:flagellar attachment zone protein, partial [Trypanosoma rangeli]
MASVVHSDRHSPPVGAVVAYERLEHDNGATWGWALGTIQERVDEHRCVIRRWDREAWSDGSIDGSQHTITAVMHELQRVNNRMRASQHRLFDAERSIIRRSSDFNNGSSTSSNNSSSNDCNMNGTDAWVQGCASLPEEVVICIHEMKHCRDKSKSLSDELNRLRNSPSVVPSVMCFTRRCGEEETILSSSIIKALAVDVVAPTCVITEEEAASIKAGADTSRLELQQHLGLFSERLCGVTAELHCLQTYNEELEARMTFYQDALLEAAKERTPRETPHMPAESSLAAVKQLREMAGWDWEQQHGCRWVTTRHTINFTWGGSHLLVADKPEELQATLKMEVANGLRAPPNCVGNATFQVSSEGLAATFDVFHPSSVPGSVVDAQLRAHSFPYLEHLHHSAEGPKQGLDRAIEDVCRVLRISEGKYNGLRFSEFIEELTDLNMFADKDAYESEVGELLMMLDKLYSENRTLQHSLVNSNAEVRKLTAEAQRERNYLQVRTSHLREEIARLNDVIARLRELADRLESELQQYKMQHARAQPTRTTRRLPDREPHDNELYCITLQVYDEEKERATRLQHTLEEEKQKNHATLLELQSQNQQLEAMSEAQEGKINKLELELRAFRQKRHDSITARSKDGILSLHSSQEITTDPSSNSVHPDDIDQEPLFSVTLDELNAVRNTNEKLAEEVLEKATLLDKLAEEMLEKEAENRKLAEDLAEREAENEKLAKELLERDVYLEGLQTDTSRSLGGVESRCRALEELVAARDAAAALEVDVLEGELAEALVQLKVVESENAALHVLLGVKNAEMAEVNEAALGNVRELESRLAAAEAEVREERGKQEKLMSTTQGALRAMGE